MAAVLSSPASQASVTNPVKMLVNGHFIVSKTTHWKDIVNPATQEVLAQVPFSTPDEINAAIASAKEAFKTWRNTPIGVRARIML